MKIALWVITITMAVLLGLWLIYVKAPPPAELCEHISEVSLRESAARGMSADSQAAVLGGIREGCIQHKLDKIQLRGRIKYAAYAKCVMAADSLATIEKC